MDKENGPGDHLKKQTLGDEEEKSPQTPAILAALNLIKIKELQNETLDSSPQKDILEPKTVIQDHRSGAVLQMGAKPRFPLQEIADTPKIKLEGVTVSLLHSNAICYRNVSKMDKSNSSQLQETSDTKIQKVQHSPDQEEISKKDESKVQDDPVEGIQEHGSISENINIIRKLQFGRYEIETTFSSAYPEMDDKVPNIYVCEFCLKYMYLRTSYSYHLSDCKIRRPPGSLVYRKDDIHIYEVDGNKELLYCQFLCLMSKLFLENKETLYTPNLFLFYILCLKDKDGEHLVGYFSREKKSTPNINLNCIVVLPPYMRRGYGKLLIDLSYEISRKEGVIGGPKKPLSEVARLCYLSYWGHNLLELLRRHSSPALIAIEQLSETTGFLKKDIMLTLKFMKIATYYKDGCTMCTTPSIIENRRRLVKFKKPRLIIYRNCLAWKTTTAEE